MKRIICYLLAFALLLCGCGDDTIAPTNQSTTIVSSAATSSPSSTGSSLTTETETALSSAPSPVKSNDFTGKTTTSSTTYVSTTANIATSTTEKVSSSTVGTAASTYEAPYTTFGTSSATQESPYTTGSTSSATQETPYTTGNTSSATQESPYTTDNTSSTTQESPYTTINTSSANQEIPHPTIATVSTNHNSAASGNSTPSSEGVASSTTSASSSIVTSVISQNAEVTPTTPIATSNTTKATSYTTSTVTTSTTTTTTTIGTSTTTQTEPIPETCSHVDANDDGDCDVCAISVLVYFDFYSINDLHGKFANTQDNIGVDELTTYLKNANETDDNAIFLSAGDMWQGSAESNMTKGKIIVDWMNELHFSAMTIGNHEFDWGEEYIDSNAEFANFPFVAINVYDRSTNALVDFCTPSVMVERDGMQIGIIGAAGDNYSSIAVDKCDEVYFKTGRELTNLVKAESERLRSEGADFIIYLLHDGYGESNRTNVTTSQISSYYDISLSNGYIDLVFEAHTHQSYLFKDQYGVYHMQNRGDNKGGLSHVEIAINSVTMSKTVRVAELVSTYYYQNLEDDPIVEELLAKYAEFISPADRVLGYNNRYRTSSELLQIVAQLYYEAGVETWGDQYDIVLGGGFMSARSPYNLYAGEVTYGKLQGILPFDNQLTLCSVSGYNLRRKFLETTNDRYYIYCGEYGNSIRYNIDPNATYYIITDSYSAYYAPNQLTVIEEYDPNIFARDLLADYIEEGNFS